MARLELSNGSWAVLKDGDAVLEGDLEDLVKSYEAATGSELERALEAKRALFALLVDEWSFDIPLPRVDPAAFRSLKRVDTKVIEAAALAIQADLIAGPDFTPSTEKGSPT